MGAAVSCALFEFFSTALHWFVQNQSGCEDILHYLDDFLFNFLGITDIGETRKVGKGGFENGPPILPNCISFIIFSLALSS
jgi:hypothetical protein